MITRKTRLQLTIGILIVAILGISALVISYVLNKRQKIAPTPTEAHTAQIVVTPRCNAQTSNVTLNYSITLPSNIGFNPCKDVVVRDLQTQQKNTHTNICNNSPITGTINSDTRNLSTGVLYVEVFNTGTQNPIAINPKKIRYAPLQCTAATSTPTPTTRPSNTPTVNLTATPTPTGTVSPTHTPTPEPTATTTPTATPTTRASATPVPPTATPPATPPGCYDTAPPAPTMLTAVKSSESSVTLTWTQPDANVEYYIVSYGYQPNTYLFGVPNTGKTTSYQINSLDLTKTFYFVVRSQKGCAVSTASNEISYKPTSRTTPGINQTPTPTPKTIAQTTPEVSPTLPVSGNSTPTIILSSVIAVVLLGALVILLKKKYSIFQKTNHTSNHFLQQHLLHLPLNTQP